MRSTLAQRLEMARFIVSVEARRDKNGNLRVYKLPAADGGGTYEIAGINDRFHPDAARRLKELLEAKRFPAAEEYIVDYLLAYTDIVTKWTTHPAIEAFLRDSVFNRGPRGALRILQIALRVIDDGNFGPKTRATLLEAMKKPDALLSSIRRAREAYERKVAPPVGARAKFWVGLVNRWNKAYDFAKTFIV
jgi:hypothetical protein